MKSARLANPLAAVNDTFRRQLLGPRAVPGQTVMTAGIAALPAPQLLAVFRAVATFDTFTPANDPYGEHDCALLDVGGARVMFKIDYYADASLTYGADDPAVACHRVLTIMFAREY